MQQGRLPSRFLLSSQQPSMMALSLPLLYQQPVKLREAKAPAWEQQGLAVDPRCLRPEATLQHDVPLFAGQ